MCRMLLVRKKVRFKIGSLLEEFAAMCEVSPSPDGDWQGDGWGISWIDENDAWHTHKSSKPIWKNYKTFDNYFSSTTFMVHARSKSFISDVVGTYYNQPYTKNGFSFVFNGQLHGVRINIPGEIGAEKVFRLALRFEEKRVDFLEKVRDQLNLTTKKLIASNIIMADKERVYALCDHNNKTSNYHSLRYVEKDGFLILCSQKLSSISGWKSFQNGEVKAFHS